MAIDNQYDEVLDGATNCQKERDSRVRSVKSYRQVKSSYAEARTGKSTENSTEKSTKILQKPPIESAPMQLTGWSLKRRSKYDYHFRMILRVNANYGLLPAARYTLQSMRKHYIELRRR
jgi:hypothetical protein